MRRLPAEGLRLSDLSNLDRIGHDPASREVAALEREIEDQRRVIRTLRGENAQLVEERDALIETVRALKEGKR